MSFVPQNRLERLIWEAILEMEHKGVDVSEFKSNFLIKHSQSPPQKGTFANILAKLRFTMEEVEETLIPNPTNLSKIEAILDDCRIPQSKLVKETVGTLPFWAFFFKNKLVENIRNADIVFASVVDCNPQLWDEVTEEVTPSICLLVYSLNPKYMRNVAVLKQVSKLLNDFKHFSFSEIQLKYSSAMIQVHSCLNNLDSKPHIVLDTTLLQDINIWDYNADIRLTYHYIYYDTPLKNSRLPSDGILPFIRYRKKNFGVDLSFDYAMKLIPSKYYE